VAGIADSLITPDNQDRYGLSLVEQFSSPRSAAAELAHETGPSAPGGPWTYFAVSGMPQARGFETIDQESGGRNVGFADGAFYYVVGAGWNGGASNAVSRAQVIAATLRLFHRVHGRGAA
jgi:hypothetical protein